MASNQISANHHWRLCVFAVLFFDKNYDNRLKIFQEHTLEYKIEKQQEQFLLRLKAFPQRVNFILNSDSFTK